MITIGRTRIERCVFILRCFLRFSEQFRRGGLKDPDRLLKSADANGIDDAQGAQSVDISRVHRQREWSTDVRLSSQIVDLIRLNFINDFEETGAVGKVAVVQVHGTCTMSTTIGREMFIFRGVERTRFPHDPVHLVAFGQQQFGQIGSILQTRKRTWGKERRIGRGDCCTCPLTPVKSATFGRHSSVIFEL